MATVIRNLPWFEHATTVTVQGQPVVVKPEQIVFWISVAEWGMAAPHVRTPRFPAILDTGCNHNLVLQERHLVEWAGVQSRNIQSLGAVRVSGHRATRIGANVWLHRNRY